MKLSRKFIERLGSTRRKNENLRLQLIEDALQSIKDVATLSLQNFFCENHTKLVSGNSVVEAKFFCITTSTKNILEAISVVVFVVFFSATENSTDDKIISISLVLAIIVRMLPLLNRVAIAIQAIQFSNPVYMKYKEILLFDNNMSPIKPINIFPNSNGVCIPEMEVIIGNKSIVYPSIVLQRGKINYLVGPSGAGKTTYAEALAGLRAVKILDTGNFLEASDHIVTTNYINLNTSIMFQKPGIFNLSFKENILIHRDQENEELDFCGLISQLDLTDLNSHYKNENLKLQTNDPRLSGGEKQRLGFSRTVMQNSEIYIFDEPTSALDLERKKRVAQIIRKIVENKIVLLISHDDFQFDQNELNIIELRNE